jgi:hypothetical protein
MFRSLWPAARNSFVVLALRLIVLFSQGIGLQALPGVSFLLLAAKRLAMGGN